MKIPSPRETSEKLLRAIGVENLKFLGHSGGNVVTRKNIAKRRKTP